MGVKWLAGVACAIGGTIVSNFGQNLQKLSLNQYAGLLVPSFKQPYWCIGFALTVVGTVADLVALSLAAQSIVAPLTIVALISNLIFAKFLFGEVIKRHHILGTAVIVVGNTLVVLFGDHNETHYDVDELARLSIAPLFLVYLIATLLCVALLIYYRSDALIPRCLLPGLLGAQSFLCGKILAELVSTSIRERNQLVSTYFWIVLVCLPVLIVLQQRFYNGAIKRFPSIQVIPLFQCIFSLGGVIGAFCFFQEYQSFNPVQATIFPLGLAVMMTGVYMLCRDYSTHVTVPHTCDDVELDTSL